MRADPFDAAALRQQIQWQRERTWDVSTGIPWDKGVDATKDFLPLDKDAIAFPGASRDQRRALSQYLGLVINGTISEMEGVIHKLKDIAWNQVLRSYPVNPEMWELGELFFEEEIRHSRMFGRYNDAFCREMGVDPELLNRLLPRAFGSWFQKAIIANSRAGGHAFWWLVASAEEVSIEIYRNIHQHVDAMDPLYHLVHKKHLEDESRHRNYAFLMLNLIEYRLGSVRRFLHRKTDLLFAQAFTTGWVLAELTKVFEARRLRKAHPFFDVVASTLPLIRRVPPWELAHRLFVSAPYISLVLNTRYHRHTTTAARDHRVLRFPFPQPKPSKVGGEERWKA